MATATAAAAILLGLLALAAAHLAFWSRVLRMGPGEAELVRATTDDRWVLALWRRRPRGPARGLPVLLVHGLAVNHLFMDLDLGDGRTSLAAHLAGAGFDCFSLDLRGHGGSRPGPAGQWTFDDYVGRDLPAALRAVSLATGAARALVVGHSQGALVALAGAGLQPGVIAGVVAMAGPTHVDVPRRLRVFARAAFRFRGVLRLAARAAAPFAGLVHGGAFEASINSRNVERRVLRRLLYNAVENVPTGVALQLRRWIRGGLFCSADGSVDYRAGLSRSRQPALFVSGAADGLAPPAVVRAGFEAWGGPRELLQASLAAGFSADYGHGDLVLGRRAPEEIYAPVIEWLTRVCERKEAG